MDEKQVVLILITVGYAWVIDWQPQCICYLVHSSCTQSSMGVVFNEISNLSDSWTLSLSLREPQSHSDQSGRQSHYNITWLTCFPLCFLWLPNKRTRCYLFVCLSMSHLILKKERKKEVKKKTRLWNPTLWWTAKLFGCGFVKENGMKWWTICCFFHRSKISYPINCHQKFTLHNKFKQQQNTKRIIKCYPNKKIERKFCEREWKLIKLFGYCFVAQWWWVWDLAKIFLTLKFWLCIFSQPHP
jgi:hypothetical protein